MKVHIATGNAGKLREFREMLEPLGFEVHGLEDVPGYAVIEDADTFAGNAKKKALALAALTGEAAMADDSGLVVDALEGAPGVHSARYAGVPGPAKDAKNREKLVAALAEVPDAKRTARFVCALCYVEPGSEPVLFEGTCEGAIGREERGSNGFGYDPIFVVPGSQRTMAELASEEKNEISHRGRALRKLVAYWRERHAGAPAAVKKPNSIRR